MFGLFINWDDVWNNIRAMIIWVCMQFMQIAKSILNLIFDLANITFFKDETIGELLTRVYIVVGVLMLFKITISCIQYLVNPDKVDDKENGFGGIAKRTIISVLLLALVPGIFQFAKEAQGGILEAIPAVILGQESLIDIDDMGGSITYTTTLSFFGYTSDSCNDGSIQGHKGGGTSSKFKSIDDIINNTKEITSATCNGGKRYDFNILLCLAMGIFLVFILISMVIDIGIRVVKFGFLELIAPIPIASYIDPKTSKKSFDSWVQNSVSVYADLFIRLGVIYLILYLFMTLLPSFQSNFTLNDGTTLSTGRSLLVNVAIIVSLFFFAKNAPKFICDVLGIKDNGNLTDMFKRATGLPGIGLAGAASTIGAYRNSRDFGNNKRRAIRDALRAGTAANLRALNSVRKGDGFVNTFKNSRDKALQAANKRIEYRARGGTGEERAREMFDQFTGYTTGAERINQQKGYFESMLSLKSNEKKNALAKVNAVYGFVDGGETMNGSNEIILSNGHVYTNYREFRDEYDKLMKKDVASRTAAESARLAVLEYDKTAVEGINSEIKLANGNSYASYGSFLQEINSLEQLPPDKLVPGSASFIKLETLKRDKDAVEKFMIKNQSYIALTNHERDEGNYSAIANDVIKIVRSGTPQDVAAFIKNIGDDNTAVGNSIVQKLTNHENLTSEEAICLNKYIAGKLEGDAQAGHAEAVRRERTLPKKGGN